MMKVKKQISIFLAMILLISGFVTILAINANAATGNTTEFAGGTGTAEDPYLISTKEHLNNVRNDLTAHYKLIADVVFDDADFKSGGAFYNEGKGWIPIGDSDSSAFTGLLDGNGNKISNLYVKRYGKYTGLFGHNKGTISNLALELGEINIYNGDDIVYAGAFAGYNKGAIKNCYSAINISAKNSGGETEKTIVGGIVGYNTGTISNCYNIGSVYGQCHSGFSSAYVIIGGLCGKTEGTIESSYNIGQITYKCSAAYSAKTYSGELVGEGGTSGCYYLSGCLTNQTGGLSNAQMSMQSSFETFDFSTVWVLDHFYNESYTYPTLQVFTPKILSLNILSNEHPVDCLEGEVPNNLNISIKYEDGKTATGLANIDMFEKLEPHVPGNQRIKLKYRGTESSNDVVINVKPREISSLVIKSLPAEALYMEDEASYSVVGGIFTVVFSDGYTVDLAIDNRILSKAAAATKASQIVLTYRDKTIEFVCEKTYAFASGGGTAQSPFVIKTTEHLISSSKYPNGNFVLGNNIKISTTDYETEGLLPSGWTPFVFSGVFDGRGYSIVNLRVSTESKTIHTSTAVFHCYAPGLFSTNNGTIKNLTIEDARYSINAGVYNGGFICAENNGTITNCHSKNSLVVFNESNHFGGIVGDNKGTIQNCTSENTLTLDNKAGKIGGIASNSSGNIIGCTNRTIIISAGSDYSTTGGIVATNSGNIVQCRNLTAIATTSTYQNRSAYSGGIVGLMTAGEVKECYNTGLISAQTNKYSSNAYAGGLVGYLSGGTVSNCYNTGNVSASNKAYSGKTYAGGLLGYNKTIDDVVNCYAVCQAQGSSSEEVYVGIICGYNSVATIKNCYYVGITSSAVGFGDATYVYGVSNGALQSSSTFNDFDFATAWKIQNDIYAYPQLVNNQHVCNHIFSDDCSYDDYIHWYACNNKGCNVVNEKSTHIFAHACDTTCDCGYTRTIVHDFTGAWQKDDVGHWHVCETPNCEVVDTKITHSYDHACDTTCDCGYARTVSHNYANIEKNETEHWYSCSLCGSEEPESRTEHSGGNANCQTQASCIICGELYGLLGSHNYDTSQYGYQDAAGHAHKCSFCGVRDAIVPHSPNIPAATEESAKYCTVPGCEYVIEPKLNHVHKESSDWEYNEAYHWHDCVANDNQEYGKEEHTYDDSCDATCNGGCGYARTITHNFIELQKNSTEHWHVCSVCNAEKPNSRKPHGGGMATCTELASCSTCQQKYGEFSQHSYGTVWEYKTIVGHAFICTASGCTAHSEVISHVPNIPSATEQQAQICIGCGFEIAAQLNHVHNPASVWSYNDTQHWHACSGCTMHLDEARHDYTNDCDATCDCGYTRSITHNFAGAWQKNDDKHWHICTTPGCDMEDEKLDHIFDGACDATCDCGYTRATTHDFAGAWHRDENGHWHECVHGCGASDTKQGHSSTGAATETSPELCSICGWEIAPALVHQHQASAEWQKNATHHWNKCTGCLEQELNKAAHADSDNNGKCDACEYQMSIANPSQPGGGTDTSTTTGTGNSNPSKPENPENAGSNGCAGSFVDASMTMIVLAGAAMILFSKKVKEQ